MVSLKEFYEYIEDLKYEYGDFDYGDVEISDVRVNEIGKWIELDFNGSHEVIKID